MSGFFFLFYFFGSSKFAQEGKVGIAIHTPLCTVFFLLVAGSSEGFFWWNREVWEIVFWQLDIVLDQVSFSFITYSLIPAYGQEAWKAVKMLLWVQKTNAEWEKR